MNDKELTRLTYKELQALASKYRVPGNIKKKSMIKVIEAARKGNHSEVAEILNVIHQTRKKRIKKIKPDIKVESSNYEGHRYHSRPTHPLYSWGPNPQIAEDEDLSQPEDDQASLSNFNDFHRYLLHRGACNYSRESAPSVIDMRTNEESSQATVQAYPLDLHRSKNTMVNPELVQTFSRQILESNSAHSSQMLLKRMLQAPTGSNLKDLVCSENHWRFWPSEDSRLMSNFVDDSDTLTADSESFVNDDLNPLDNNNDEYFGILEASKHVLAPNSNVIHENIQAINQMTNNYVPEANQHCRHAYQHTEVQQTCQKWLNQISITPNHPQECDQANPELFCHANYNGQGRISDQQSYQEQYQGNPQQMLSYNMNQVSTSSSQQISYYPDENSAVNHDNSYYNYNQSNIYEQNAIPGALNAVEVTTDQQALKNFENPSTFPGQNDRFHGGYCQGEYSQAFGNYNPAQGDNPSQQHQEPHELTMPQASDSPWAAYWPRWTPSVVAKLENLLNLQNNYEFDESKIKQTASVYCYETVTTARHSPELGSVCNPEKHFWAEMHQQQFSANSQLYNDTSMGLKLDNSGSRKPEETPEYGNCDVLEAQKAQDKPKDLFYVNRDLKLEIVEDPKAGNEIQDGNYDSIETGTLLSKCLDAQLLRY